MKKKTHQKPATKTPEARSLVIRPDLPLPVLREKLRALPDDRLLSVPGEASGARQALTARGAFAQAALAARIALEAMMEIGRRLGPAEQGRPPKTSHTREVFDEIDKDAKRRYRRLAFEVGPDGLEDYCAALPADEWPTLRGALGQQDGTPHVGHNSGDNEWYTPPEYLAAGRVALGGPFDLDPASSEAANEIVQAATFFDAKADGLAQEWPVGRVWINPPYAQPLVARFAERFAAEMKRGSTGIALVNNATETAWFHGLAVGCAAIAFPLGRIRFLDPAGEPSGAPLQGQALVYHGPDIDRFAEAFSPFGLVMKC